MRIFLLLAVLALAACSLPGRQTLAADPVPPRPQDIAAIDAFAGRIPLVTIQPDTVGFDAPLKSAVAQALAIKPNAAFAVIAEVPRRTPDEAADALQKLVPLANAVAQSIRDDGMPAARVSLGARSGEEGPVILVYVK